MMRKQQELSTFIIVNKKPEPPSIEHKLLQDYARFILIDENLEQMNELALYLEESGKTVYIIKEVDELKSIFEESGKGYADKTVRVHVVQ